MWDKSWDFMGQKNGIYMEVIWDKSWDKHVELYGIFHDHFRGIKSWDFAVFFFGW